MLTLIIITMNTSSYRMSVAGMLTCECFVCTKEKQIGLLRFYIDLERATESDLNHLRHTEIRTLNLFAIACRLIGRLKALNTGEEGFANRQFLFAKEHPRKQDPPIVKVTLIVQKKSNFYLHIIHHSRK